MKKNIGLWNDQPRHHRADLIHPLARISHIHREAQRAGGLVELLLLAVAAVGGAGEVFADHPSGADVEQPVPGESRLQIEVDHGMQGLGRRHRPFSGFRPRLHALKLFREDVA